MRKKIAISIFLFFLCSTFSFACADDQKELTYRNIPWGTSVDKINDPASVYSYESKLPWEESFLIIPTWRSLQETDYLSGYEGVVIGGGTYKVGGYALSRINIYCMYGIEDGKLLKEPSDSEFYAADYVFDVIDTKAAYESLFSKMTDLYGTATTTVENADASLYLPDGKRFSIPQVGSKTIWDGANDTHILLYAAWIDNEEELPDEITSDYRKNYKFIYMTYYKGGVNERLKEICRLEEQLEKKEESQNNSGYDGL